MSPQARQETDIALRAQDYRGTIFPEVDLETIEIDALIIAKAITMHLTSMLKDRGGRPREYALDVFLIRLGNIFRKATGREPTVTTISTGILEEYSGDFFFFAKAYIKFLGRQDITNAALARKINRLRQGTKPIKKT